MKLRGWTILWTMLGLVCAAALCIFLLFRFNLLAVRGEIWMDLYTGDMRLHKTCMGITIGTERLTNFSSGYAAGGNLSGYEDPLGRTKWKRISTAVEDLPSAGTTGGRVVTELEWRCYNALMDVTRAIDKDPRPGFPYDPPAGYERATKRQLLLNCLRIARETDSADAINSYYRLTVNTLRPNTWKAVPEDLPDVDEFLKARSWEGRY